MSSICHLAKQKEKQIRAANTFHGMRILFTMVSLATPHTHAKTTHLFQHTIPKRGNK